MYGSWCEFLAFQPQPQLLDHAFTDSYHVVCAIPLFYWVGEGLLASFIEIAMLARETNKAQLARLFPF
jgi:hypothetical protein